MALGRINQLHKQYQLVNDIANAKNNDNLSLAVYLDITKAFDTKTTIVTKVIL